MNKLTHFKSFNLFPALFILLAVAFLSACGGDDSPEPDCSSLTLTATAEGFTVAASADGGASPYEFQIDGGAVQSSGIFADLDAGTYVVTVIDANNCTKTQTVEVNPCADFSITASASAYDITINVEGGTAPYQYLITYTGFTDTENTSDQSVIFSVDEALATGIVVTDANGCETQASLTAEEVRTFTDSRDGQEYLTIKIGEQIWFAENFNYNTNTADSTSSWYYNDDSVANAAEYGRLYTWYVATSAAFTPEGWKIPTETDWANLVTNVGGSETEVSSKLQRGGSSGFNAPISGRRSSNGTYGLASTGAGLFWSTTDGFAFDRAGAAFIESDINESGRFYISGVDKDAGISVRFLKEL